MYRTSLKPATATKNRMRFAVADKGSTKSEKGFLDFLPVKPGNSIVPAVCIIVALPAPADFVALQKHEYTLGKQQGGEKIPFLAVPKAAYVRVVCRTFRAAIPGAFVVFSITVFRCIPNVFPGRPFTGYLSGDAWSVNQWDMIDHFRFYIKVHTRVFTGYRFSEPRIRIRYPKVPP